MPGARNGQFLGTQLPFFGSQTVTQGSSAAQVIIPAAIHFWPMTDGGVTFVDNIGTTNLTAANVTYSVVSGLGAAAVAHFNGTTSNAQAASVDASLNFNGSQPMTVAYWLSSPSLNSATIAGTLLAPTTYAGWEVGFSGASGNQQDFLVVGNVTTNQMSATVTTTVAINTPILFVVTYTGSLTLAGVKMYQNGILQSITDPSGTLTSGATSTAPFFVGSRTNSTGFFNGALAYMRVWNSVLTPAQISKLFLLGPQ